MKKIFCVLMCSAMLAQSNAMPGRAGDSGMVPKSESQSELISVKEASELICRCETEEDIRNLLVRTNINRDVLSLPVGSKRRITRLFTQVYGDDDYEKERNRIISKILLELHPEKFIDLRSISCIFEELDDDNKLRFLTMLTEEKYPLGEFDPIDVSYIWMCICDDRDKDELREKLASKIARLVVSNSLDHLEEFDAERQMCLFFLITMKKKISPDLSEALDVVVDRYIHFLAQRLREMEITSFNRGKERILEWAAYYANLFTFPFLDYYPADNCAPKLKIWKEDETAANDRIVSRILKSMEAFSKDDPIYFYFCETIFNIIMPRIPVDQIPHAMWLYWNVSKEKALKRVLGKSYVYRLYGDSCKTLGRAAADGLVKGYGENKAFFTPEEACIVVKHATSRNEALRTLVNEGRIDFGESAALFKFSHFNDSEVESFLSKFVQVEK